ncbi:isoprenoid synthase domain-containing protein [Aspergillus floccosus]
MSEAWCQRHHAHWEDLFEAFRCEAENNSRGIIPKFNDYIQLRRAAGGAELAMDWIEAVGHFELPAQIHSNPAFLSLRQNFLDIVGMTNDLFSARNEWNSGNTDNIVHVLAQREQCSWRYANELTHKTIADTVACLKDNESELYNSATYTALGPQDQANTRRFIGAMKYWMRGSLDWHYITPRYR